MTPSRLKPWLPAAAVAALALAATASGLRNSYAYDDVAVIVEGKALHTPATALSRAVEPYLSGQMLRPVALLGFATQWWTGGGAPLIFRMTSLMLYVIVCLLLLLFLRRCGVTPWLAAFSAGLFAVHPVHSEATANIVGQAELLSALFVLLGANWYLRARENPTWRHRDTAGIGALFLLAAHAKEVGYVLPGLLVLLELLVVADPRPLPARLMALRRPAVALIMLTLASLVARLHFLGSLRGGQSHLSLEGLSFGERGVAVLLLVPEWVRLLVWPARLQVEYGPPALQIEQPFGVTHLLGLALVAVSVTLALACRRRARLVTLGLAWVAMAMAPVANLLFPTEVLVAERTLFLPSVGVALVAAGLTTWGWELSALRRWHPALGAVGAGLLLAGVLHSAARQPAWRDTLTIHATAARDAPTTYRARQQYGWTLLQAGDTTSAERELRAAITLWDRDPRPYRDLGQLLRAGRRCAEGIPVLEQAMRIDSTDNVSRGRLVECLIVEQRWNQAEEAIARGLAQGVTAYQNALTRVRAGREADTLSAWQPR